MLLHGDFEGGVPVSARFAAPGVGQQLPVGGDVKIRGVLVGRIHDIRLDDSGEAIVDMRLNGSEDVSRESRAEIRSKTVFGQKWVELIPPAGNPGPFLANGDEIPDERTKEPLELERALQLGHELLTAIPLEDLSRTLNSLAEGFTGQEGAARTAIDRGLIALRAVNSRSAELDLSLRQLREFSSWLDDNDTTLLSFMSSLDDANRALVGAAPEFRSNLASVPTFFDQFADFQERTATDLGRLIQNGATLAELIAPHSDQLRDIVVNLEAFTTVWNSGLEQPCEGLYEGNMTCWQVYQPPGLESRGLYGRGEAPDADEPGDPLFGVAGESPLGDAALQELFEEAARETGLGSLLTAPLRDER
jgi:virulence factor Mce-like protein